MERHSRALDSGKSWEKGCSVVYRRLPVRLGGGQKTASLFALFTDGERRYAQHLWKIASRYLKASEYSRAYGHRKIWKQGLEVAIKIKGYLGNRRVEWVKPEHPFTAISPAFEVHANSL